MNVSTNYSTTNQAYKHLSEAERGKIEAYLCSGIKPAEIARRLGKIALLLLVKLIKVP